MRTVLNILFAFLPSIIKKVLLRLMGHNVCWSSYIGFSYINIFGEITLQRLTRIASLNIINTHVLKMGQGAKLGSFNWVAGKSLRKGLIMGKCSSIRRFHYLDTTGGIILGSNTIVAGRGTVMFSHGLSPTDLDVVKGIEIGEWVYVGARTNILPGSRVAHGVFIGMGSTVVGELDKPYSVYASDKAKLIKTFSKNDIYYDRPFIKHKHLTNVDL